MQAAKAERGGLDGVMATTSAVSSIMDGTLTYRGYDVGELSERSTFEETVYLLWWGHLPTATELSGFRQDIVQHATLSRSFLDALSGFPEGAGVMEWLRTAISLLGLYQERELREEDQWAQATRLLARFPTVVAAIHRIRSGLQPVAPKETLSLAGNMLYMLTGVPPEEQAARALDEVFILHADHELNASTFAARVTASTLADLFSSVVAGLCALGGSLHGGASEGVMRTLQDIGDVERVPDWVRGTLARHERIMGFGHRVYRSGDPRAERLKALSERLAETSGDHHWHDITVRLEAEVRNTTGLRPNVDLYSASVYTALGIPRELFTPLFAVSRVCGWIAHVVEQYADNRLIRPRAEYVGPSYRAYSEMEHR